MEYISVTDLTFTSADFLTLQQEAVSEETSSDRLAELAQISTELARVIAQNPNTPSEVLRSLSDSDDTETRQNVAGNPNTPTEVLWELGDEFPQALLDNPIFSLLFLENPNLVEKIPQNTLISLFTQETLPDYLREALTNYPNCWMRRRIAENPKTHVSILELLAKDLELSVRLEVAKNSHTPASTLQLLAKDSYARVRRRVAQNGNTPVSILELLAKDIYAPIRQAVAGNSHTPASILELLAKDNNESVRWAVAENGNTPVSILELLAQDNNKSVREKVTCNPNNPGKGV